MAASLAVGCRQRNAAVGVARLVVRAQSPLRTVDLRRGLLSEAQQRSELADMARAS